MLYVTSDDMKVLYEEEILVQATNYSNSASRTIDEVQLNAACEAGSQIVDSYLLVLPVTDFSDRFLRSVRVHAAHLALDHLASSDPQIREQAKESIDWLKLLQKLSPADLKRLAENISKPDTEGEVVVEDLPAFTISTVEEGRRWEVSFL